MYVLCNELFYKYYNLYNKEISWVTIVIIRKYQIKYHIYNNNNNNHHIIIIEKMSSVDLQSNILYELTRWNYEFNIANNFRKITQ